MHSPNIIDFVARNGLATINTLHAALAPTQTRKEVERAVTLLVRKGVLVGYTLQGREDYYRLSARICRERGLPEKRSEPLGPQALVSLYAFLLYTIEKKIERLTKNELLATDMGRALAKRGIACDRYVQTDGGLSLLVVDHGCQARTMKRKIIDEWFKRKKHADGWGQLMESGRFLIVAIVPSAGKAELLRKLIGKGKIRYEVAVYPELAKLFGGDGR